jgi:hypothetical protein
MAKQMLSAVLFDAGQIVGMLLRYSPEDYQAAAREPSLSPLYQRMLEELAELREALDSPGLPGPR